MKAVYWGILLGTKGGKQERAKGQVELPLGCKCRCSSLCQSFREKPHLGEALSLPEGGSQGGTVLSRPLIVNTSDD